MPRTVENASTAFDRVSRAALVKISCVDVTNEEFEEEVVVTTAVCLYVKTIIGDGAGTLHE